MIYCDADRCSEFDAHKNINTVIIQFLCRNKGKGFSAKEIADAIGIKEEEVNHAMVKLSLTELFSNITAGIISKKSDRIDKKTHNGKNRGYHNKWINILSFIESYLGLISFQHINEKHFENITMYQFL